MNLNEVAELSFHQLFPKGSDETAIDRVEFQRTAYAEFAYQTLMACYRETQLDGYYEVPSYLLTEVEKDIVNNEMDISDLKTFKSLPKDIWLQNIGGMNCQCKYVKSTANLAQLLCEDDSLPDSTKTYYITGKKIKFPQGTHKNTLPILYANMGESVSGYIEVEEDIAALVRQRLNDLYLGKVGQVDTTNNSNANS